jgi:hypothetical protein
MSNQTEIISPLEPDPATRGKHCVPVIVKNPGPAVYNPLAVGKHYNLIVEGLGSITGNCLDRRYQFAQMQTPNAGTEAFWINTLMIQKIISGDPV